VYLCAQGAAFFSLRTDAAAAAAAIRSFYVRKKKKEERDGNRKLRLIGDASLQPSTKCHFFRSLSIVS
jgi:hypothetical protein